MHISLRPLLLVNFNRMSVPSFTTLTFFYPPFPSLTYVCLPFYIYASPSPYYPNMSAPPPSAPDKHYPDLFPIVVERTL